jgi:hypothetical protein
VLAHIKQVKSNLENRITEIKDYQSPDTKEKICKAKKIEIQATINVLKSQDSETPQIKQLIKTLENRITALKYFPKTEHERNFTSAQLLGEKEIKGIGKVFNFSLANKQESMLKHMANQLTDLKHPDSSSLATEHFTERMLMQSVLEKVGIMDKLVAVTDKRLAKKNNELRKKIDQQKRETDPVQLKKLDSEIIALNRDIATINELSAQIAEIWKDGSYRDAGNEPYKLASRVALLSHLLGGGTVFNCKSGKDRTGQLDAEVKFLAFQIRTSNGKVPKPDRKRTYLEKIQFATFIFFDESRRTLQEFNTGYGGSKLVGQPALYGNFIPSTGDAKADKKNKAATISQFQGKSGFVPS